MCQRGILESSGRNGASLSRLRSIFNHGHGTIIIHDVRSVAMGNHR